MGSVIDYQECPNCKMEATSDFYYKTGEEYVNCPHCGYHYSATIKNREKLLNELTKEDWDILEHKNPYGCFRYKMAGDIHYHIGTLVTEEDANNFRVAMKLEYQDHVEMAYISRVVDGKKQIEYVVGKSLEDVINTRMEQQ
jgi:Zn ribbon nucleic-acid-binding protein